MFRAALKNSNSYVKEARQTREYSVWLHSCEIVEQAKLIYSNRNLEWHVSGCAGQRVKRNKSTAQTHQENCSNDGNYLYPDHIDLS